MFCPLLLAALLGNSEATSQGLNEWQYSCLGQACGFWSNDFHACGQSSAPGSALILQAVQAIQDKIQQIVDNAAEDDLESRRLD